MKMTILSALAVAMMTATTPAYGPDLTMSAPGETETEACNLAIQRVHDRYEDGNRRVIGMTECRCSPRHNTAGRVYGYVCEVDFSYERRD